MVNLAPNAPTRKAPILILILVIIPLIGLGLYAGFSLLDGTPPTLTVTGLEKDKRYRGSVTLDIAAMDEGTGVGSLTVQLDDAFPIPLSLGEEDSTSWTLQTATLADGSHTVFVKATDRSLRKNRTQSTFLFYIDNTQPKLHVPPETLHVGQGRTLALFVQADESLANIGGKLFNKAVTFYATDSENLYRSFLGISVTATVQSYPLTVTATDLVGNQTEQTFQVEVTRTAFARGEYIILSPQKQRIMMDRSKSREDNAKRGAAYAQGDHEPAQLWEGKFIRPTEGRLTSPFGKYREYNTGVRRHHYGTDIANLVGTPIYASNRGIVTLADRLHLYGNAVILNHGQGVSSSYSHLSEIHVKVGERVKKGQRIGSMGATGQATGSHLHWGMVVNGVAVAPEEWTERNFSSLEVESLSLTDGEQR